MKLNKKSVLKASLVSLAVVSVGAMAAGSGTASATSTSFDTIFEEVKGWLVGAPGKIIAVLAFGAAMFNVVKQNFLAAVGAFIGALFMAFAGDVIDAMFTAGI